MRHLSPPIALLIAAACSSSAPGPALEGQTDAGSERTDVRGEEHDGSFKQDTDTAETGSPPAPDVMASTRSLRLEPLRTCEEVTGVLRHRVLAAMNAELDAAMAKAKVQHRARCVSYVDAGASPPPVVAPTPDGPSTRSGTNNQVAGVDEPDLVKNDGKYLYLATGRELRIVHAWPPEAARTVARVRVPGSPQKLFVHGDRAVVFSALGGGEGGGRATQGCTYGYGCVFGGDGRPWGLFVYDLGDRTRPVLIRELRATSSLVTARRIDSSVHAVLAEEPKTPFYATWPDELARCGGTRSDTEIAEAFARLRDKNARVLGSVELPLPVVSDTIHAGAGAPSTSPNVLAGCGSFYRESGAAGQGFTSVLSFDMNAAEAPSAATIYSRAGAVYASAQGLYLAVPQQHRAAESWYPGWESIDEITTVHRFALEAGPRARFAGSGAVKGRVLNQFAMDEHEGHLRIATTTGHLPDPNVHSTLSVIGQAPDGTLAVTGQVDRLAPAEDIRSVRFDGKRGYVVTFKKTDPLFVFDLSDPTRPRVEAELKIPGFSTYIHRMDETHLLTVGYDAEDQGSFAYFTGVLLQIFDVADPRAPRLQHRHVIGTRGSTSEALTNHLAFTYFPPKRVLLLPMTICEAQGSDIWSGRPTFSGLLAFDTTSGDGFRERGRLPFTPSADVTCGNWWTDASSQVRRSIVMDNYVFAITDTAIKASTLDALAAPVATVRLDD